MTTDTRVHTRHVSGTELHLRPAGQFRPQPAYVALSLRSGALYAEHSPFVGNENQWTADEYHGFERHWQIDATTKARVVNALIDRIAPLAQRMLADWDTEWDGNNHVAQLGDDGAAASGEIAELCAGFYSGWV
jgi:hypothetical protein